MDKIHIQSAAPGDAPAVFRLLCACRDDLAGRGIRLWGEVYEQTVAASLSDTYVAKKGSSLVATITLDEQPDVEYEQVKWLTLPDQKSLCVHRLAVHPDFQRCGLGRWMMLFAEHLARSQGLASIRLDVYSGNPSALAFYDNLGYPRLVSPFPGKPLVFFEKVLKPH